MLNYKIHKLLISYNIFVNFIFLKFRPCWICMIIFSATVFFLCYSDADRCALWPVCETVLDGEMCKSVYEKRMNAELRL